MGTPMPKTLGTNRPANTRPGHHEEGLILALTLAAATLLLSLCVRLTWSVLGNSPLIAAHSSNFLQRYQLS